MAKLMVSDTSLTAIADAIREKSGTSDPLVFPEGFTNAITGITAGAPADVAEKDVNFYDYDGTRLYSYTLEEAQALTALPALPSREGLVCQEWNYTLEAVNALTRATDVGATYITDDGATRLYIIIPDDAHLTVSLCYNSDGSVVIDWGDGSDPETYTQGGVKSHNYSAPGDYMISMALSGDSTWYSLGNGDDRGPLGAIYGTGLIYQNMLKKLHIGQGVQTFGYYTFKNCTGLEEITLPNTIQVMQTAVFENCYSLRCVVFSTSMTFVPDNTFEACGSLERMIMPYNATGVGDGSFRYCTALHPVTLPDGAVFGTEAFRGCRRMERIVVPSTSEFVNSDFAYCQSAGTVTVLSSFNYIYSLAFAYCYGVAYYDFTACTAVPTLENVDAFKGIPSACEIRVPSTLVDEWKAAANWADLASQIVGV